MADAGFIARRGCALAALLAIGALLSACVEADAKKPADADEEEFPYDPFFDPAAGKRPQKGEPPLVPITSGQGRGGSPEAYPKDVPSFGSDGRSVMTFFVTSAGATGNLGGVEGADARCQALATRGGGGDHSWRAYLSASTTNARDRIGAGPWTNHAGAVVASGVATLHDPDVGLAGDLLDENGGAVPGAALAILTGTQSDGTAASEETCRDWTSEGPDDVARVGSVGPAWNAGTTSGCAAEGRVYCFAID
jgi:hypothetical protein